MQWYEKDAPAAVTAPRVYHLKEEPAQRFQSTQTEVAIPTLQALIPSVAWGMLAAILVWCGYLAALAVVRCASCGACGDGWPFRLDGDATNAGTARSLVETRAVGTARH